MTSDLISLGEGQTLEFKESIDKNFATEIVAFANASGGKILLGVKDNGTIIGVTNNNRLKSQIIDIARNCDPSIIIELEYVDNIIIINILEGKNKPYSCKEGFYLRIGANSQKLKRDEIINLGIKTGKIRFDEQICDNFNWNDFDKEKFEYYLKLSQISNNLDFKDILESLNVTKNNNMTYAGILMFAKEPFKYIKSSKVRCIHFNDDNRIEILDKKEVDKGILGNIEFAINYLKERIPVRFEIKGIQRTEFYEYPEEVYREAIVNAIIHRDYFEQRADIAIEKLKTMILINNPGGLLYGLEDKFGKISISRNRLIADLVSRTSFMEKAGTGIKRMTILSEKNKNQIDFKYDNFFFVEIKSNKDLEKDLEKNLEKDLEKLNQNQKKILKLIKEKKNITQKELSEKLKINEKNIRKNISKLKEKQLLRRVGADKGGYWEII